MIGNRLRSIRESAGLSQKDIATERNVSSAAVSQHESGKNEPDAATLCWYAKRFNVSADWLLGLTDDPVPKILAEKQEKEIVKMIAGQKGMTDEEMAARLPEDLREIVAAMIRIELSKQK